LLIEELSLRAVGITLQRDGAVFQMWQQVGRDRDVVVDNLPFGETNAPVENLVRICQTDAAVADAQRVGDGRLRPLTGRAPGLLHRRYRQQIRPVVSAAAPTPAMKQA